MAKTQKEYFSKGEVVIYQSKQGPELSVRFEKETVWLTQAQVALLFGTARPAITKHLGNIFSHGELKENSVCSILEHTAADGKSYKTQFYNLDAIISVGYRVNSKHATPFRIWATKILKSHLIHGYTLNEKRLLQAEDSFKELQETICFLREKSTHELLAGQGKEILTLLADYSKTLVLLQKYDHSKLSLSKKGRGKFVLDYETAQFVISEIRKELMNKKEAGDLFGQEPSEKLKSIIGNLRQTFGGKELYPSLEEKASHLLYLIIKDHPFIDGNKRIASFLFVYFLDKNNYLYRQSGEKKINDNALVALALLIAVSDPHDKDTLIKIVTHLLTDENIRIKPYYENKKY